MKGKRKSARAAKAIEEIVVVDVPLARLADVKAAVAEPFARDRVLAHFGVDDASFKAADSAWSSKLAADPAAIEAYRVELARAEDELARATPPIDEDPAAWAAFLRAYEREGDPFAWLTAHDLGVNDMSRLARAWARRVAADPRVGELIAAARASEAPPPTIRPAPRRAPWSAARQVDAAPSPIEAPRAALAARASERLDAIAYAALVCALEEAPDHRDEVVRRRGLTLDAFFAMEAAYASRFAADAQARRDFELFKSEYQARVRRARAFAAASPAWASSEAPAPSIIGPTVDDLERTLEMDPEGLSITLPFVPSPAGFVAPSYPHVERRAPVRLDDDRSVTIEAAGAVLSSHVPFAGAPPSANPLVRTGTLVGLPLARWPFVFDATSSGAVPPPLLSSEPARDGATGEIANGVLREPLPFVAVPAPSLTLKQHASLTVELAVGVDAAERVLARYRVTSAERASLDAHYGELMRADAAARAAWREACSVYLAWLHARG